MARPIGFTISFVSAGGHWQGTFRACQNRGAQLASFQTVEKFDNFLNLRRHNDNQELSENI